MNYDKLNNSLTSYASCRKKVLTHPTFIQEIVDLFLDNVHQGEHLRAFVRLYASEAKASAQKIAKELAEGKNAPLTGLVVGIKDLFCYQDHPVQASSRILEGFVSQINATVINRLQKAGAIILGHQNCDEFGMGSANTYSVYGPAHNPIDPQLSPGGSSGGSAVAVRAHMCHVSLGTDTGGSVRQPAALCGIVGLKPTYARISRYGVIAYSSSFDTVGILAHNVEDCALTLTALAGKDEQDATSSNHAVDDYTALLNTRPKKLKIGYLKETLSHKGLQPEIRTATENLLKRLTADGHQVTGIAFPWLEEVLPTYYILTTGEVSTELSRYDGVRYGYRAKNTHSFQEMVRKTRTEGFGEEVKRRLLLGAFVLTSDYYDSYYGKACKVRQKIRHGMLDMLKYYDYLICPTTPTTAFPLHQENKDPITQYLADLYTVPASVAGVPAISLPYGHDQKGLPIGVQIMGAPLQEQALLQFANYIMTA